MRYKTSGVCSSAIEFELDDQKKIHNVKFQGGCSGNTQACPSCRRHGAEEAIRRLEGIRCGVRSYILPGSVIKSFKRSSGLIYLQQKIKAAAESHQDSAAVFLLSVFSVPFITKGLNFSGKTIQIFIWTSLILFNNRQKPLTHCNQFFKGSGRFTASGGNVYSFKLHSRCLINAYIILQIINCSAERRHCIQSFFFPDLSAKSSVTVSSP